MPKQLPKVPPPVNANTGEEERLREISDDFFMSVLGYLDYTDRAIACFVRSEERILTDFTPTQPIPTADSIRLLIVKDVPVASSIHWRNQGNYILAVYAHYLAPEVIEKVRWKDPPKGG